ncbi:MAG: hypothetical protein AAGJ52_09870, partial [Pseudomonadota bacterium]
MNQMTRWLSALALLMSCSAQAQVSESERQALIDFYHSTNGPQWLDSSNWLGPEGTECDWQGIWCYEEPDAAT